jgi:hypothetical protein
MLYYFTTPLLPRGATLYNVSIYFYFLCSNMTSSPFATLMPPVRVLLRVPPDLLDRYGPTANTELIKKFSTQAINADGTKVDANTMQHLITRTTIRRAMIVMDYYVTENERQRESLVAVFDVKWDGSHLPISVFHIQ